jgi:hypothetical protein
MAKRRSAPRWGEVAGAPASTTGMLDRLFKRLPLHALIEEAAGEERMVRVGCPAHNCGGRCLLRVFVRARLTHLTIRSCEPAHAAARTGAGSTIPIACSTQ